MSDTEQLDAAATKPAFVAPLYAGSKRIHPLAWAALSGLVCAAAWIAIDATEPVGMERLHLLNRTLVRIGLPLFLAAFLASSLRRLFPSSVFTRRLLAERRGIGVAWAVAHLIHAAAIIRLGVFKPADFGFDFAFFFGALGFVFTIAMLATSNDAAVRALGGKNWARLHRYGIRYLMFIYLFSYGGRFSTDRSWWPFLALILGAIGVRIYAGTVARGALAPRRGDAAPA